MFSIMLRGVDSARRNVVIPDVVRSIVGGMLLFLMVCNSGVFSKLYVTHNVVCGR